MNPDKRKLLDKLWVITREVIIKRDVVCKKCGRAGQEIHHIKTRNNMALYYDFNNLIYLCRECHQRQQQRRALFLDWFISTYPERWEYILNVKVKSVDLTINGVKEMILKYKEML